MFIEILKGLRVNVGQGGWNNNDITININNNSDKNINNNIINKDHE